MEAVGFSGGIWVFWKDVVKIEVIETHRQFIVLKVSDNGVEPWFLYIVYGSPNVGLRQRLWSNLRAVRCGLSRHGLRLEISML